MRIVCVSSETVRSWMANTGHAEDQDGERHHGGSRLDSKVLVGCLGIAFYVFRQRLSSFLHGLRGNPWWQRKLLHPMGQHRFRTCWTKQWQRPNVRLHMADLQRLLGHYIAAAIADRMWTLTLPTKLAGHTSRKVRCRFDITGSIFSVGGLCELQFLLRYQFSSSSCWTRGGHDQSS